ncbi:hypothetical protein A5740_17780 [Mycobacterium sp. GA-1841]|nr:hypothetical protein A5740_17780 [Mycobacterium sp. GA-1841]
MHHVVIAIAPERIARVAQLFTDLGFQLDALELADVGLRVLLDWTRGMELVTPLTDDPDNPVRQFLDARGDGLYMMVVRVDDIVSAEQIAERYGATSRFRQHRDIDPWQLDEIEMSVLGLPVTLLATDLP